MPGAWVTDDLPTFFATTEFATAAIWYSAGGDLPASVIFDNPAAEVFGESTAAFPRITYQTADWPALAMDDLIDVAGTDYRVHSVLEQSDGQTAIAELREVA